MGRFSKTLKEIYCSAWLKQQLIWRLRSTRRCWNEKIAAMPAGLETLIGSKGVRLSGGQMQRTAAARMFVHTAERFIFDDLSSALDVETEQKLWDRLAVCADKPTCLLVSRRRFALHRADHITVLKDGKIEDEGSLDA